MSEKAIVLRLHTYSPKDPRRGFYASKTRNDYLAYMERHAKVIDPSFGLLDKDGELSFQQKKAYREKLRATQSPIRDIVISFDGTVQPGRFNTSTEWRDFLREAVKEYAHATGQKEDNLEWVGAFHGNTQHRHAHLMVWEKERTYRQIPVMSNGELVMDGNAPRFIQSRKKEKQWSKTILPRAELDLFRERLFVTAMTMDTEKADDWKEIRAEYRQVRLPLAFKRLLFGMPLGANYNDRRMERWRPVLDRVTDDFIESHPDLFREYRQMLRKVRAKDSMARDYAKQHGTVSHANYEKAFVDDCHRRIGNLLIRQVDAKLNKAVIGRQPLDYGNDRRHTRNSQAKTNKHILEKVLGNLPGFIGKTREKTADYFDEYQRELRECHFRMLVDQGYIDINGNKLPPTDNGPEL